MGTLNSLAHEHCSKFGHLHIDMSNVILYSDIWKYKFSETFNFPILFVIDSICIKYLRNFLHMEYSFIEMVMMRYTKFTLNTYL